MSRDTSCMSLDTSCMLMDTFDVTYVATRKHENWVECLGIKREMPLNYLLNDKTAFSSALSWQQAYSRKGFGKNR